MLSKRVLAVTSTNQNNEQKTRRAHSGCAEGSAVSIHNIYQLIKIFIGIQNRTVVVKAEHHPLRFDRDEATTSGGSPRRGIQRRGNSIDIRNRIGIKNPQKRKL